MMKLADQLMTVEDEVVLELLPLFFFFLKIPSQPKQKVKMFGIVFYKNW